jgi:hypothetical protein
MQGLGGKQQARAQARMVNSTITFANWSPVELVSSISLPILRYNVDLSSSVTAKLLNGTKVSSQKGERLAQDQTIARLSTSKLSSMSEPLFRNIENNVLPILTMLKSVLLSLPADFASFASSVLFQH